MSSKDTRPAEEDAFAASAGPSVRARAEQILRDKVAQLGSRDDLSPEATEQALHELRVHQIELELQNEELRRAQIALDAERSRYFDLYDLAPVGYCSVSKRGQILQANLTACTLLGTPRGALVGQRFSRFIQKEDQDVYYLNRIQGFESSAPKAFELRMVKHDGTLFWAHLATSPAQKSADGVPMLRIALSDITERKHVEKMLVESAEELRSANENIKLAERAAKAGAYSWNFKTGETKWSSEFFRLFGLDISNNKASYETWQAALHPDDLQKAEMEVAEAIRDRKPFVQEYRVALPGGGARWIAGHGDLVCDDAGLPQSLSGFCIDITGRKEMELAIARQSQLLQDVVDNMSFGLMVCDKNRQIILSNDQLSTILDLPAGFFDQLNVGFDDIIRFNFERGDYPDQNLEAVLHRFVVLLEAGKPVSFERTQRDGSWLEIRGNPLCDGGNLLTYANITERKAAEARLVIANTELAFQNEEKGKRAAELVIANTEISQRAEELQASVRFARGVLDALSVNLAILDENGTIIAVNQSWERFARDNECEPSRVGEGVNYLAVCDAATGADAAQMAAGIRSIISGERDEFIEEYHLDSPKEARWFQGRVTRFSGEGAARVVVAHEDITARKRADAAVRKLSRAVEQSPVSIVITDRAGNIEYVNTQFEKQTGYALAEVLGRNPRILQSGRTPAEIYREMWRVISAGGEWRGELSNRRKDGELLWESVAISGLKDENGQVVHFIAAKEDISERKQAAEVVRQARQRELRIGFSIQRSLQGELPASFEGVWLAAYAEPSQDIDGDFYSLRRFSPDCFEVLIGDVMGKGVAAALMGAGIMSAYSNALVDLLAAEEGARVLPTPAAIVNAMHRALTPTMIALSAFATLALYRFDLDAGTLTWVNAGHTAGLLTTGADSRPVAILGDNLPIGVMPEEVYVQFSLPLGPGASLLIFSDGITEACSPEGEEFGLARLTDLIEAGSKANLPPGIMMHALRGEQRRFTGGGPGKDDLTALMIKLHPRRHEPRGGIEDRVDPVVFTLPWSLEGLTGLRARIAECAGSLPAEDADALILASFEAATNVIHYAQILVGDATLTCSITREGDAVAVELIYPSEAFTPPAEVQVDLSGEKQGGFGLYIIEQSVDSVEYASPMPGVASVRLVKHAKAVAA